MYDPKFTQKEMYDQYGRSRPSNKKVDPKPSRGSGFSGMGADPAERFGGSPTKGLGSKPFERGSTYDVIPTPPQRDDKPDPPTSIIDTVKNKAVELFKSFGGDDPKDTEVDPSKVYRGPLFRGPINPGVIEARIRDAVDYSKAPPLFYSGIPSDANMRYDVVPPITANKDRVKNAVNAFLKQRGIGGKEYTIKRGDTLSEIAQREGVAIDDLAKVNKIENINRILAGETLIIPPPQEMERAKDIVDSVDPDAQFYQSGVPLDQRIFEPELGYDEIPLPSEATVDKKIRGLGARPEVTVTELDATTPTTLTAAQRTALSDLGSDVARTNLQNITNAQGNYSQTALTNAIDKGVRNDNKKALLKGAVETEIGDRGLVTEATGYRLNRAYEMFNDSLVDEALASLPQSEQTRIRNGAVSDALGLAIMDRRYDGGSDFRGRGLVQLTHQRNYQAVQDILATNGINIDLVGNPDLANDTRYALPIAMAYLEHAGLDDTTADNSSAKDLNNRINAGANSTIANERWDNVVQALRDADKDSEADRMENRNEYAAQETVGTTVDGIIGPNSRAAMTTWLTERDITIPPNATDMDLVVLVNENS